MEILETLNKTLLKKTTAKKSCRMDPEPYKQMAYSFSVAEHSVAVLVMAVVQLTVSSIKF